MSALLDLLQHLISFVFYMQRERVTEQQAEICLGPPVGYYRQRWNHNRKTEMSECVTESGSQMWRMEKNRGLVPI